MFKLRPYQQEAVAENRRLWSEGVRNPCTVLPTGAGKCHRKGTLILMFDGSIKKVEDVQVGDKLMGPDSTPRTVLALGRGTEMMYEVAPVKGEPYYVNESHILSLRMPYSGELRNVTVPEYLEIHETFGDVLHGWRVPNILDGDTSYVTYPLSSVTPVGVEPYYGFEIDGDHLYLLGDFTVTHNTVVASELIRQEQQAGGYFAAIAHRQELVGQISLALARQGVMHDIVAPRPVVRFCSNQHVEELGQSFYSPSAPGFVGGVDTVIRREMGRIKNVVSLLFQDECFPAGTLIAMADGTQKPIEAVRVGDYVMAFDESDRTYATRRVETLYRNPAPKKIVRIETYSGTVLQCTANHPIWLSRSNMMGWRQAVQLIGGQIAAKRQELLIEGCWQRVKSARYVTHSHDTVYNFAVAGLHTYIANGVVVHNCHHVLRDNKWGKAAQLFPKANGLYVTATPLRADGKGLGRHADGLFDELIIGPSMRDLIRMGSLTDYRIFAPPTDIDLSNMVYGADGDYSRPELVKRAKKSGIIGDVVSNYEKYCENMQTVVFTVDVEQAHDIAKAFEARGIRAVALSANNTDKERQDAITAFRRKEIKVIVNVDLLGEGFDCPAIEAVIMARPTASYGLYVQVFGRALRLLDGKLFGLIIDMVGNVKRHGLPDAPRQWSLDRREKRGKSDANDGAPVKTCPECMGVYQIGPTRCPYCGHVAIATGGRGELVVVDAELRELTPEELAQLRGEADKLTREWAVPHGASKSQAMAIYSHNKTVRAQAELRDAVALWAGALRASGFTDDAIHVMMHRTYGTNVSALQVMRPKEAGELKERIMNDLRMLGVA
ncbi:P-loop containing nucleoside triphosphate hydrolase [Vibrio phage 13VV501A]|nr:P-loop containing nucleoside triphosphate hydrolase [Vibrio phage 13VV501A]